MATFYVIAGVRHFLHPTYYLESMPTWIPFHMEIIYISGACEIAGGIGMLIPWTRKIASWCLLLLIFVVLPVNVRILVYNLAFPYETEPAGWLALFRFYPL